MPTTEKLRFPSLVSEQLSDTFRRVREMHARIEAQAPAIEGAIRAMDADVARALHEDDDHTPLSRLIAYRTTLWAQHGWFPSAWETPLSLIGQTAALLGTSQHEEAEEAIAAHFERDRAKLVHWVIEKYPEREAIISDALAAHDEGRFALSIPVFLTQADGIGAGYFGIDSIYSANDRNFERIKTKFDQQDDGFRVRYIHFLIGSLTPLNASRSKRERYSAPFNRHTVIHGESTDYPSKVNSLKSISWLHFVGELTSPLYKTKETE